MRIITCRARTWYHGRTDLVSELAERCLLIRDQADGGDGSVVVFAAEYGVKPTNWMPAGSIIRETEQGFEITHPDRNEYLRIEITEVLGEQRAITARGAAG